jgi:hypothetical protein
MKLHKFASVAFIITAPAAQACLMDAPQVTQEDVANAPEGMVAVQAVITAIEPLGDLSIKPHGGFVLDFDTKKNFQGEVEANFSVQYGGCHNLPGKVGDVIYVLALKDVRGDWYAPQFWHLRNGLRR